MNLVPTQAQIAAGTANGNGPFGQQWADFVFDATPWGIKGQILLAKSVGCNAIRALTDSGQAIANGAYSLPTFLSRLRQVIAFCESLGMGFYYSSGAGNFTTGPNFTLQSNTCIAYYQAVAHVAAQFPNVFGFDLSQEYYLAVQNAGQGVSGVVINNAGTGGTPGTYPLVFTGGSGPVFQAQGTYTIDGTGGVVSTHVPLSSYGYTVAPTVAFPSGGVSGATGTATITTLTNSDLFTFLTNLVAAVRLVAPDMSITNSNTQFNNDFSATCWTSSIVQQYAPLNDHMDMHLYYEPGAGDAAAGMSLSQTVGKQLLTFEHGWAENNGSSQIIAYLNAVQTNVINASYSGGSSCAGGANWACVPQDTLNGNDDFGMFDLSGTPRAQASTYSAFPTQPWIDTKRNRRRRKN